MATTYRAEVLAALKNNESAMTEMFRGASDAIRGILARNASNDIVPLQSIDAVQTQAAQVIQGLFIGRSYDGSMAPFDVISGRVSPVSPYSRILFGSIRAVTRSAVVRHHDEIMRRLAHQPALLARMRAATLNPLQLSRRMTSEQVVFNPNPLAQYEPAHRWVDPSGYRLSDRIWRTSISTRRYIDQLMEQGIRRGIGATRLANMAERALWPGRRLVRTSAPYGMDASADAMRLARTEITRANAQADSAAAATNPFVETYEVVLSGSHPNADICDDWARGGPYPKSDTEHLPPAHPYCLCYARWGQSETAGAVIDALAAEAQKHRSALLDVVGPLLVDRFVDMLLSNASFGGGFDTISVANQAAGMLF
jgi:hypothetical protein